VGGIISFWWAASFRYDGRHHLVLVGDIVRNQHPEPSKEGAYRLLSLAYFGAASVPAGVAAAGL
jgi:hypothetical protein